MPIASIGILVLKDDKVLLVRHEDGSSYSAHIYGLPAGKVETGETDPQAAVRELKEETGLETEEKFLSEFPDNRYLGPLPFRKDPEEKIFSWHVFLCQKYSGSIREGNQETTPMWIDIDKIDTLDLLPNIQDSLDKGLKFIKQNQL